MVFILFRDPYLMIYFNKMIIITISCSTITCTVKFATSPLVLAGRCTGVNIMVIRSKKRAAPTDAEASAVGQRQGKNRAQNV